MLKRLLFIFFIIISACSKTPLKNILTKSQTIKIPKLSLEELERRKAINTYRVLRLRDSKQRKLRSNKRSFRKKYSKKKTIKYNSKIRRTPKPVTLKKIIPSYPKRDPEEIMLEINQNLTYFCMKNRKSKRFKNQAECKLFTQEKLLECQDKHIEIDNARLIRCIKTRLRF
ncbi:MAG: hypothetical protein HN576_11135 [Bacteriovoracaceae bacterium]|jgi:hypothetical protein|nr:hypothetical protein [Bacteriovoracaceae bacterium]